eukprot:TRINITY_DN9027_c0_g1_i2.p1 TRINITY_DN9027_c0_g1~~TRINITY_DN9027_c0_g1_i2.p1  ORF type:complete len:418 (+),score=116.06 TRINITY_DN9027_c0_g1_i2:194-1447(+)
MTTEEKIVCSNWYLQHSYNSREPIEKSKMMLHERYCIRNLYRCKDCDKVVEKKDKEAHNQEFHTPTPCSYCTRPQEKTKMEEHLKSCPKKPKECPYCELEFAAERFDAHVTVCGSKTTPCPKCNKYVQRKEWDAHQTVPCELKGAADKGKEKTNAVSDHSSLADYKKAITDAEKIKLDEEYAASLMQEEKEELGGVPSSYKVEQLIPSYRHHEPVRYHRELNRKYDVPQRDAKKTEAEPASKKEPSIKKWDDLLKQLDEPYKKGESYKRMEEKYKKWDDLHKPTDYKPYDEYKHAKKEENYHKKWENIEKNEANGYKKLRESEKQTTENVYKRKAEDLYKKAEPSRKHEDRRELQRRENDARKEHNARAKEDSKLTSKEDRKEAMNRDAAISEDELLQKAIAESLKDAQGYSKVFCL